MTAYSLVVEVDDDRLQDLRSKPFYSFRGYITMGEAPFHDSRQKGCMGTNSPSASEPIQIVPTRLKICIDRDCNQ
jgi:hypothetical protein